MSQFLEGKKTYIVAACIGLVSIAWSLGFIDEVTRDTLFGLLSAGGFASLRLAIK